jgi:hypothetical protein
VSEGGAAARGHFVAKWLAREPEMRFVEPFCPAPLRGRFLAWGALMHELRETLFELSDPGVARAKAGWWAETLLATTAGESRHPLLAVMPADAPWRVLAGALVAVAGDAPRVSGTGDALARLLPAADAASRVEAAVFGGAATQDVALSLAVHWLLHRLPHGLADDDQARIPMHLLARHGLSASDLPSARSRALLRDWGTDLLAATPVALPEAALFRRARHRLDRVRLRALARTGEPRPAAPPTALWHAWHAAREAPRAG